MTQIHWLNPVSADFNAATDWSTGTVPGPGDTAILDAAGSTPYAGTATHGVLTVTAGHNFAHINLIGNYLSATFITLAARHGGVMVVAKTAPASSPAHGFIAAAAGLGGSAAGTIHATAAWADHAPMLARPHAMTA